MKKNKLFTAYRHKKLVREIEKTPQELHEYFIVVTPIILDLVLKEKKKFKYSPSLFSEELLINEKSEKIAFETHQLKMLDGKMCQILLGNFYEWQDLKNGHETGLDCRKLDNSIILEVKNSMSHGSSLKVAMRNLIRYKKKYPETRCVFGVVNTKRQRDFTKTFTYEDVEIERVTGEKLLALVFTLEGQDFSDIIIEYVKNLLTGLDWLYKKKIPSDENE